MRAPAFWWRPQPTLEANLLCPLARLYGAIAARRLRQSPAGDAGVPVVCVGNFTVGGSGKTPAALAIAGLLAAAGETPFFLTRGYRGRLAGPVRVDAAAHRANDVGDEPLLLARACPTIVARDRRAGARLAVQEGASIVIMDDGLQNPSLRKDVAFAVVDAATGLGNGLCLPAGPLRAPLAAQWPHVDALILVGPGAAEAPLVEEAASRNKPVFRGRLEADKIAAASLGGRRLLAFAGIGFPEKFFATLEECGAIVVRRKRFSDHHPYSSEEIRALVAEAEAEGLAAITTEKDFARISGLAGIDSSRRAIAALPVRLLLSDEDAVRAMIEERVRRLPPRDVTRQQELRSRLGAGPHSQAL
jgi:tetraacyldisaccharide 4'-kinase